MADALLAHPRPELECIDLSLHYESVLQVCDEMVCVCCVLNSIIVNHAIAAYPSVGASVTFVVRGTTHPKNNWLIKFLFYFIVPFLFRMRIHGLKEWKTTLEL